MYIYVVFHIICVSQSEFGVNALDQHYSFPFFISYLGVLKTCSPAGLLCQPDLVPCESPYVYELIQASVISSNHTKITEEQGVSN